MKNKFWEKQCPLTNKDRLYMILHGFKFCTYKNQSESYCHDCEKGFIIEKAVPNYKTLARELNRVYLIDLVSQVVQIIKENHGIEITEKAIYEFAKKYKEI